LKYIIALANSVLKINNMVVIMLACVQLM